MGECWVLILRYEAARGLDPVFVRGYDSVSGRDFIRSYDLIRGHRVQLHLWTLVPIVVLEEAVSLDLLSDLVQLAFLGWICTCSGVVLASRASRVN